MHYSQLISHYRHAARWYVTLVKLHAAIRRTKAAFDLYLLFSYSFVQFSALSALFLVRSLMFTLLYMILRDLLAWI